MLPDQIFRESKSPIHILKYPNDIKCEYVQCLKEFLTLWDGKLSVYKPNCPPDKPVSIDLMVHLGIDPSSSGFLLETRGRRDGYEEPGEDGLYLDRDTLKGYPEELYTGLNVKTVASRLSKIAPVGLLFHFNQQQGT